MLGTVLSLPGVVKSGLGPLTLTKV